MKGRDRWKRGGSHIMQWCPGKDRWNVNGLMRGTGSLHRKRTGMCQ